MKASLPSGDATRDLTQIITFVLRKFFKRVEEDPFLIVEAIMPKGRGAWKVVGGYITEPVTGLGSKKGGMTDLEFVKNKKLSWDDQMSVLVATLVDNGDEQLVEWVIDVSFEFPVLSSKEMRADLRSGDWSCSCFQGGDRTQYGW